MNKVFTLLVVLALAAGAVALFGLLAGDGAPPLEAGLTAELNADNDRDGRGLSFETTLTGDQEVVNPLTAIQGIETTMIGELQARFDEGFTQVEVKLRVRNVPEGVTVTRAHFHCNRAGASAGVAFGLFEPGPLVPTLAEGQGFQVQGTLTNANFNMLDCVPTAGIPVNNIAALAFAMREGLIYANVHSTANTGGEIRGQMLEGKSGGESFGRGR